MWKLATVLAVLLVAGARADDPNPCASTGQKPYDYKQALCMSILFYEAQRSGKLPGDMRISWRGDSAMGDGQDNGLDLTGGYYDAGDHVKFGFPMAYSITVLSWSLLSYESGYKAAGQVDFAKAAIKWGTDYFKKAHPSDDVFWGQVGEGNTDHSYWGRAEDMTMDRPSYKIDDQHPGSDLAGETAAALTAASMVLNDNDLLNHAKALFAFADNHRGKYDDSITDAHQFYASWSGYEDELAWAAIWLYKATKDSQYESKAKQFWSEFNIAGTPDRFDWDNKFAGAQVLFAEEFGDSEYKTAVSQFTSAIRSKNKTPGGMVYIDQWGSLRYAVNVAFICLKAADLGIDASSNRDFAKQQINYALGSLGHSYMVGFGNSPPERPHHRGSSCPDPPASCTDGWAQNQPGPNPQTLWGAIVGGPDNNDNWNDDRNDYTANEVACDYNAALTGVLAYMAANS